MSDFSPEEFFDLSGSPARELFADVAHVWDAVGVLPEFIEKIMDPQILGEVEEGAWLEPGAVRLEEGARVERGAIVRGPTIIGRNTVVRTGAYIRGHVMVGEGCMIGHGTETRQVLVLNNSNIPHLNCVFTSLVGNRVKIGGTTSTANFLQSGKEIEVRVEVRGEKMVFPTGLTLLGAIIGDDTSVGGNTVMMPGTLIGQGCQIYPMSLVSGFIPHGFLVRPKSTTFELVPRGVKKSR